MRSLTSSLIEFDFVDDSFSGGLMSFQRWYIKSSIDANRFSSLLRASFHHVTWNSTETARRSNDESVKWLFVRFVVEFALGNSVELFVVFAVITAILSDSFGKHFESYRGVNSWWNFRNNRNELQILVQLFWGFSEFYIVTLSLFDILILLNQYVHWNVTNINAKLSMGKHPCPPQFKLQVLYKHSQNVDEEVIKIKAFSFLLLAHLLHGHFNCSIYLTVNRKKRSLRGNNFLRESPIEILKLFAARTFASAYLVRWFKDLAPYARRFSLRWWDREGSRDSSKRSLLNINWPKGWLIGSSLFICVVSYVVA